MRKLMLLVVLLSLSPLFAQESPANPSRLRVASRGAEIVLSWEAALDAPGGWAIFRSSEVISAKTIAGLSRIMLAAPADRTVTLAPPDRKAYFYALLALDKAGKPTMTFLPGKSVTAVAIIAESAPTEESARNLALLSATDSIGGLGASAATDSVKLTFSLKKGAGTVLVYRSPSPIVDSRSLFDATLISTIPETTTSFVDYPVPGVSYYYALLPEVSLKAGSIEFKPGVNATKAAVAIVSSGSHNPLPATGNLARSTPLPSFVQGWPGSAASNRHAVALSAETEKAIASILAPFPARKPKAPAPTILPEDRVQARGGEDYALSLIITGPFKKGDYVEAAKQLQDYLSLNRSLAVSTRAHFYLGQALARNGYWRDAFFELLQARSLHAGEARPWIQYVIAQLRA